MAKKEVTASLPEENLDLENSGLSAEEILKRTQLIEAEKAEKKRQREHRRRLKEIKAARYQQSRWVGPIILLITLAVALAIILVTNLRT